MQIKKEEEARENDEDEIEEIIEATEEEQEKMDELDAESRRIYDPIKKIFDDRKRRVTDLKECSRVTLPKPLAEKDEALIEMRMNTMSRIYTEYRSENCDKIDKQVNK